MAWKLSRRRGKKLSPSEMKSTAFEVQCIYYLQVVREKHAGKRQASKRLRRAARARRRRERRKAKRQAGPVDWYSRVLSNRAKFVPAKDPDFVPEPLALPSAKTVRRCVAPASALPAPTRPADFNSYLEEWSDRTLLSIWSQYQALRHNRYVASVAAGRDSHQVRSQLGSGLVRAERSCTASEVGLLLVESSFEFISIDWAFGTYYRVFWSLYQRCPYPAYRALLCQAREACPPVQSTLGWVEAPCNDYERGVFTPGVARFSTGAFASEARSLASEFTRLRIGAMYDRQEDISVRGIIEGRYKRLAARRFLLLGG